MMQKSSLSNFCLTNVRNLKVFLEVHGRDIDFAKSEQSYNLTSTDAEAAANRLLLPLHRKRYIPVILHCMHSTSQEEIYTSHTPLYAYMGNGIKPIFDQVFDPMTLTCCFCF